MKIAMGDYRPSGDHLQVSTIFGTLPDTISDTTPQTLRSCVQQQFIAIRYLNTHGVAMEIDENKIVSALIKNFENIDGKTTERILHQCIKAAREQRYFGRTYGYPEEWRPVLRPRFEQYCVSNWGYVRLASKSPGRILRPALEHEYARVGLSAPWRERGGAQQQMVHELVAESFILGHVIPKEQRAKKSLQVVNHKDGDKWHPALDNLEITTQSDNMKHAYDTDLRKGRGQYGT